MVGQSTVEMTEQVRRASDIVDVVSAYVTLKRAGRYFKGLCPFHNEKTPSFHVSPERQTFKCFGCGAGGDAFKFIQLRESVSFVEARAILAARAGIPLPEENPVKGQADGLDKQSLERVNRWAAAWFAQQLFAPAGAVAREYLKTRGLTEESVRRFGLGYAPESWSLLSEAARRKGISAELLVAAGLSKRRDDGSLFDAFRHRVMFPIQDALDRVIGFGGRTLGDDPAKYVNSPQSILFDKSRCLYGIATAKDAFRESKRAVVVEGYLDCLMAQQAGICDTVATLGTALTTEHVHILRRYVDGVVLLFDADEAGRRAVDHALRLLMTSPIDVRLAQVPEGKDPADLLQLRGPEPLRAVLTSATGALESKWSQITSRFQGGARGPEMRRAMEEFLGLIAQSDGFGVCDPIQRGLLVNQIGKLLGLSSEEVHRQIRRMSRSSGEALPVAVRSTPRAASALEAATRELLEVLLNEPEYFESVRDQFDPAVFSDERLRSVSAAFVNLISQGRPFSLSDLISRFEPVEMGRLIVDLQMSGERGGNYAARVEGAVATLQKARDRERVSQLRASGEAARGMGHFAARRHRTATPLMTGAAPGVPQTAD